MDNLLETINRQCCLHCEMECDGKWLETEIEIYKEDLLKKQAKQLTDLEAKLAESEKVIEAYEMKEKYLKKYYNFTDEQCKMHDLLTQLWHLTYLPNKHFAEVLRSILKEVENVKNV